MKTIANYGLMEVISEDNKDTIIFNHSSGCVTFVIIFDKGKASIKHAYWSNLSFGGSELKISFLFFSSKFSRILIASSESRFFKINTILSLDKYFVFSVCIASFNSINIDDDRISKLFKKLNEK